MGKFRGKREVLAAFKKRELFKCGERHVNKSCLTKLTGYEIEYNSSFGVLEIFTIASESLTFVEVEFFNEWELKLNIWKWLKQNLSKFERFTQHER